LKKKISLYELVNYQRAFDEKKAHFGRSGLIDIIGIETDNEKMNKKIKLNSIVAPLVLKHEIIGALELYSPNIDKIHAPAVDNFAKDFSSFVASSILFHEIKFSETRYRDLFENAKEGFAIYNSDMKKFIEINRELRSISGYTADEFRQMKYLNIFNESERGLVKKYIEERTKNKIDKGFFNDNLETSIIGKNSTLKYVNLIINQTVKKSEWFFIINDITKNKSSEIALAESKQKYKKLWDFAPVGYHILDTKGNVIQVNKTEAEMLGYSKKEMEGKSIFKFIAPEERQEAAKILKAINADSPILKKYNRIFLKKDGSRIYASVSSKLEKDTQGKSASIRVTLEDITENNLAKNKLEESEAKYRQLVDNANDGLIIVNQKGNITFNNQHFLKITGYSQNELSNFNFFKIIHPDDLSETTRIFNEILKGQKKPSIITTKAVSKNNEIKFLSNNISIIKKGKNIIGIQVIIRDITENIELQKKIEWSKNHYEQVIDTIQDAICAIDKDLKIISANKIFADKVNRPVNKLKGLNYKDSIKNFEKSLLKTAFCKNCNNCCLVEQVFIDGEVKEEEVKYLDKKGEPHYYKINIFPGKNEDGIISQAVITIRDVTEKRVIDNEIRRLNELNKSILDNSPISIIALDKKGNILSVNKLGQIMMGKSNEETIGKKLIDTDSIKSNPLLIKAYDKLLDEGKSFQFRNIPYFSEKKNKKNYFNIIAAPLFNNNQEAEGAISMAMDNTESVMAKQKLEMLNRELEKKVIERTVQLDRINKELNHVLELKSRFISDASHELRTPLTIIQGNLDLAMKGIEDKKSDQYEVFDLIIKEINQMTRILTDLTLLTNGDASIEKINYEKVNLPRLIKAACNSLRILAAEKNIKIIIKKNINHLEMMGDEDKLEKLLLNLIRNALKYGKKNGWVKIWLEQETNKISINIKDNGIGIDKEDMPFIFERFYRANQVTIIGEGGSGLGLSICKWIVESHGGFISAESKIGEGSLFTVHLYKDFKNMDYSNSLF
jgi:PAS domain S-box-containing protein